MSNYQKEHGAVSLFVVLFSALLITVITVSFLRIMVRDQQQASTVDLSQSAYDSAQAGVEDGKRALLRYQNICSSGGDCSGAATMIDSSTCNGGLAGLGIASGQEVKVQESTNNSLDQAYTCVKMQLETADYLGVLPADSSKVIPLSTGGAAFNTVTLEWFSSADLPVGSTAVSVPTVLSGTALLNQASWAPNRPSILRTQLMQFGSSFSLNDFDSYNASSQSNASTLFLYPSQRVGNAYSFTARDIRKSPTSQSLTTIQCQTTLSAGGYACSAVLTLPDPIGGAASRTAFLRLSALYNKTNYRVTLSNSGTAVPFAGVQPQIDSTGRANNLFRRVQSRVEMTDPNFPYPDAAVDVSGNFCKDFTITDNVAGYSATCTP